MNILSGLSLQHTGSERDGDAILLTVTGLGVGEHINIILCVIIVPKAVQNPTRPGKLTTPSRQIIISEL